MTWDGTDGDGEESWEEDLEATILIGLMPNAVEVIRVGARKRKSSKRNPARVRSILQV